MVPSLSMSTLSLLPINKYIISAFLHHAIIPASLYMAKPPQLASSNAVPNAIKAQTLSKEGFLFIKVTLRIHPIIPTIMYFINFFNYVQFLIMKKLLGCKFASKTQFLVSYEVTKQIQTDKRTIPYIFIGCTYLHSQLLHTCTLSCSLSILESLERPGGIARGWFQGFQNPQSHIYSCWSIKFPKSKVGDSITCKF